MLLLLGLTECSRNSILTKLIRSLVFFLTLILAAAFHHDAVNLPALCWNHSLDNDWPLVFSSLLFASSDVTVMVLQISSHWTRRSRCARSM